MDEVPPSFGQWMQRRRQALHLTQKHLGDLVHCSADTIRKFEAEERHPSPEVARLLATALHVPPDEHPAFLRFARGESTVHPASRLTLPHPDRAPGRATVQSADVPLLADRTRR